MSKRDDHIVSYDGTTGDLAYAAKCLRCGEVGRVETPISITRYVGFCKALSLIHI